VSRGAVGRADLHVGMPCRNSCILCRICGPCKIELTTRPGRRAYRHRSRDGCRSWVTSRCRGAAYAVHMRTIGQLGRAAVRSRPGEARLVGYVAMASLVTACGDPNRFPRWPSLLDIAFACLASIALPARGRSALGVLVTVSGLSMAYQACGGPFFPALPPLMVALYTVALHSGRRQAWTAAVLTVTAMALAAAFFQPGPLLGPQRVGAVAWMGLATVVGDSVRNRRAYVRALEERAERAERTREEEAAAAWPVNECGSPGTSRRRRARTHADQRPGWDRRPCRKERSGSDGRAP
jgi:hypothetical protein